MNRKISEFRVRSAQSRVDTLDGWKIEYNDAQGCLDIEDRIAEANATIKVLFQLDSELQSAYLDGMTADAVFDEKIRKLFSRWLEASCWVETTATKSESQGYVVRGIDELRAAIEEVKACLEPNYELTEAMAELQDEAAAMHARGETTPLLDDL